MAPEDLEPPGAERRTPRSGAPRPGVGFAVLLTLLSVFSPSPVCPPAHAQRVFDAEDPPETRYQLAPSLTFGAEIEVEYELRRNLDLDRHRRDDVSLLKPELSLAWSFDPVPSLQMFLNVALIQTFVLTDRAGDVRASEEGFAVELKEAYLRLGPLAGWPSALIGRQRFEDERKWLYDEDLDAVRVRYARRVFAIELSASRNGLVRKTWGGLDQRERINNYVLVASHAPRDWIELEGYVFVRDDRTADQHDPVFLGLRSRGEPVEDLDHWLELAYVGGRHGAKTIRGWGVDLGAVYEWPVVLKPSVAIGFAFGSGDRTPEDSADTSFRQTGLQENKGDLGGSAEFKYYGEVFDPELSNLLIFTAGLGVRPREWWSVDVVYHYYLQHRPSTTLRNAAIDAEPSGRSRRLGSELDLIVGAVEILNRIEVKGVLGYFFPGTAFPGATGAWFVGAEGQFRF